MSDLKLIASADNADLVYNSGDEFGDLVLDSGIEEYVYIALFGGNRDDAGQGNSENSHWSNLLTNEPAYNLRSQTAYTLVNTQPSNNGLLLLSDAVENDLKGALDAKLFSGVSVLVGWESRTRVYIKINITVDFEQINLIYTPNWDEFRALRGL